MKATLYRSLCVSAAGLLALSPACLEAANSVLWHSVVMPSAETGGKPATAAFDVTNQGSETWDANHYIAMRDAYGTVVALQSVSGVEPGQRIAGSLTFDLPAYGGEFTYTFRALEHNVEYFGETFTRKIAITAPPIYNGMQLSTTVFDVFDPAKLSTTDTMWAPYRLRAKIIDGTAWGWHAANLWNENGKPLDNPPPPRNYEICALYWVRYSSYYGNVTAIGPESRVALSVAGGVFLTKNAFHTGSPPRIWTNEWLGGGMRYRLFTTLSDGRGGTWETSSGLYNNSTDLVNLPPPGTYQASLYWSKYDGAMVESWRSPVRKVTVNITNGPIVCLRAGGAIYGAWVEPEDEDSEDEGSMQYSEDEFHFTVPLPGVLAITGRASDGTDMFLNLFASDGQHLQSGIPTIEVPVNTGPVTYTVRVTGGRNVSYNVDAILLPFAAAPVISSPAEAFGAVDQPFEGYTATVSTNGLVSFAAPAAGEPNGLPPGLSIDPTSGAVTGTPTTAGTYVTWVTAKNPAGSDGKFVTFKILLPPKPPINLSASVLGPNSIALYWWLASGGPTPSQYEVEANNVSKGTTTARSLTLTGLNPGTLYNLKVRAASAAGTWSAWSADCLAITTPLVTPGKDQSVWIEMPHAVRDAHGRLVDVRYDGLLDEIIPMGPRGIQTLRWTDYEPSYSIGVGGYEDNYSPNDYWYLSMLTSADSRPVHGPTFVWPTIWVELTSMLATLEVAFTTTKDECYQIYHDEGYAPVFSPTNLSPVGDEFHSSADGTHRVLIPGFELVSEARHTFYIASLGKAVKATQITFPGVGPTRVGINNATAPTTGPITIGGVTIDVGPNSVRLVLPDGTEISMVGGVVSVSGHPSLPSGPITGKISLGSLGTAEVDTAGNVTITVAGGVPIIGGAVITAGPNGGGITFPNGAGIEVDRTGRLSVTLPSGTHPTIVEIVDLASRILSAGTGAAISIRDALGNIVPLPTGGILGALDAAITSKGRFQVGIRTASDATYWFDVYTFPKPKIAVDADRNGVIAFDGSDGTTSGTPYRFWVNDDDDTINGSPEWSDLDPEHFPAQRADSADRVITSARDCEDLSRIWLNLSGLTESIKSTSNDLYVGLKWKNTGTTSPAIRIFRPVDATGGLGHIKDAAVARLQANKLDSRRFDFCVVHADYANLTLDPIETNPDLDQVVKGPDTRVADLVLPKSVFADLSESQPVAHLLFEAVQEGKGELMLVIVRKKSDGTWEKAVDGGGLWLQLDDIRRMYLRVHSTPVDDRFPFPWAQTSPPAEPYVEDTSTTGKPITIHPSKLGFASGDTGQNDGSYGFVPSPDEQAKCVVFVHGIDMTVAEQRGYSQSFFKRLWWEGYRGRFVAFRWNTPLSTLASVFGISDTAPNISIFNSGEYRSWKAGTSLNKFVNALRDSSSSFFFKPNAVIGLVAHSLGNAAATEALKQGASVDSYIAMEAAIPLSCFYPGSLYSDPQPPAVPRLLDAEAQKPTPQYTLNGGYQGYLYDSVGIAAPRKVSYNNQNDFWLVTGTLSVGSEVNWIKNEASYKPDDRYGLGQYTYTAPYFPLFQRGTSITRAVTDHHEAMSFASRSRARALGAGVPGGSFGSGSTSSVNLSFTYEFTAARYDHSGQFQRNIQLMYGNESGVQWSQSLYRRLILDLGVN